MRARNMSPSERDAIIASLYAGVFETPYWTTFLAAIRRVANSYYASLTFRRADARHKDVNVVKSGDSFADLAGLAAQEDVTDIVRKLELPYGSITINRPYTLREIVDIDDEKNSDYVKYLRARHFQDALVMRVAEPDGGNGWLTLGRSQGKFPAWVGDLMAGLAPHLSMAAHILAVVERERMRADIAGDAVQRLNFGWLIFDANARVIELDAGADALFRKTQALRGCARGQIFPVRRAGKLDLAEILGAFADRRSLKPRALHLVDEPWLDMLVLPIRQRAFAGGLTPVAVGYVHGVGADSADRCGQLTQLFGLTGSEARLALALSRGRSIAEAADELNLTIETTRNYSKRIYAKTDTRGQADLVRLILASVIALT